MPGKLKDFLTVEHRRPVLPMVTLAALKVFLIRAAVLFGLQMLAYLQEAVKHSSVEQQVASQSCEVDECARRAHSVNKKKCVFGCQNCKRRSALAIRGIVQVARCVLGASRR